MRALSPPEHESLCAVEARYMRGFEGRERVEQERYEGEVPEKEGGMGMGASWGKCPVKSDVRQKR